MELINLKRIRKIRKITGKQLAEAINTSHQQIYNYENGVYEPSIETLILIAKFFNCSTDYLLGLTDIENPAEYYQDKALDMIKQSISNIERK